MPQHKSKKKSPCANLTDYIKTSVASTLGGKSALTCSNTQCSVSSPASVSPSLSTSQFALAGEKLEKIPHVFSNTSTALSQDNSFLETLSDYFNPYKDSFNDAMKYAFLLTISEEGITQCLKDKKWNGHHFDDQEIYWINQAFKAFALLGLAGTAPHKTIAIPAVTFFLTTCLSGFGVNEKMAGCCATAIVLAGTVAYMGPTAVAVGMGAGFIGKTLAQQSLFAVKKGIHTASDWVSGYMPAVFSRR